MRFPLLPILLAPTLLFAQATPTVKQAPPPGIDIPAGHVIAINDGLKDLQIALGEPIHTPPEQLWPTPEQRALVPDIEIFYKAVRYARQYGEFFKPQAIPA